VLRGRVSLALPPPRDEGAGRGGVGE